MLSTATQAAYRGRSVIIGWNKVLTAAITSNSLGPTVAARVISMVYEAAYNAWAAYAGGPSSRCRACASGPGGRPTMPRSNLSWTSLSSIAASAGLSRRHGGIHFERGDLRGRSVGRQVGLSVLARCVDLFNDGGSCS